MKDDDLGKLIAEEICKKYCMKQITEPKGTDFGPPLREDVYKSASNGIMELWKNGMMGMKAECGLI